MFCHNPLVGGFAVGTQMRGISQPISASSINRKQSKQSGGGSASSSLNRKATVENTAETTQSSVNVTKAQSKRSILRAARSLARRFQRSTHRHTVFIVIAPPCTGATEGAKRGGHGHPEFNRRMKRLTIARPHGGMVGYGMMLYCSSFRNKRPGLWGRAAPCKGERGPPQR